MVDFENDVTAQLKRIEGKLDALLARGGTSKPSAGGKRSPTNGGVADDKELTGEHGDPEAKWCPQKYRDPDTDELLDYTGDDETGKPFSECNPIFLEAYAQSLEYAADNPKPGKEKYADYNRRDARRARGWAKRNEDKSGRGDGRPFGSSGSFSEDNMKW